MLESVAAPPARRRYDGAACAVYDCEQPARTHGYCPIHAARLRRHGSLELKHQPRVGRSCEVAGCERPLRGARFCVMHEARLRKHGDPGSAERIKRLPHQSCVVDGCENHAVSLGMCALHYHRARAGKPPERERRLRGTGGIDKTGYKYLVWGPGRRRKFEHRIVWEAANGPIPDGHVIHHINGNKLDNRLENLQLMTRSEHLKEHYRIKRALSVNPAESEGMAT